jgi:hypothetical protein
MACTGRRRRPMGQGPLVVAAWSTRATCASAADHLGFLHPQRTPGIHSIGPGVHTVSTRRRTWRTALMPPGSQAPTYVPHVSEPLVSH